MNIDVPEKKNISPDEAIKVLKKNGYDVNENEVKLILDFLYFLAKLSVNQYVKDVSGNKDK